MLYLLVASVIWAFSFGIIKTSLTGFDASFIGSARLLLSLALFAPFFRLRLLQNYRLSGHLLAIGAVQYGLMYILYLAAYDHLLAHQIALFTVLTPIYVVLWSDLRQRRLRATGLLCATIAVAGAGILRDGDLGDAERTQLLVGFLLIQGANICFAVGQIEYRRLRIRRPELRDHQVHGLLLLGGLQVSALVTTLRGAWPSLSSIDPAALAALAYLGLIASGVGFFLWNAGAVQTAPATLAVLNNLKVPL
ncbi:MAG TPA: EamA family transporter, partial [Nannocystis exedens]|nr:EamA family transporter [Nannocystis exedens]